MKYTKDTPNLIAKLKDDPSLDGLVSMRESSVPSAGSPCFKASNLRDDLGGHPIEHVINHRNGDVTLVTNIAYLRFWHRITEAEQRDLGIIQ